MSRLWLIRSASIVSLTLLCSVNLNKTYAAWKKDLSKATSCKALLTASQGMYRYSASLLSMHSWSSDYIPVQCLVQTLEALLRDSAQPCGVLGNPNFRRVALPDTFLMWGNCSTTDMVLTALALIKALAVSKPFPSWLKMSSPSLNGSNSLFVTPRG